ncbi:hypothetical protein CYMTET_45037 [Cymbomonas tetramitiformis]|uniref:Uncharacterized protein n=1 Tax=Cymbomonas tetramitiformis TaxID=36881 RepID=A0AAE0EY43_9CHLO|nr:hypothetical protein CYMTET_47044 [Cymbomonas tetramitiformis]KAK3245393.1 hypothetical protein CYMTET_45037 [Cymbomonas tetramitiformis]
MSQAKGKLLGDPVGELAKLPVLADMLRAQGHGCQLVTLSSAQMLEVLIDVEHKEFLYEQKAKPVSERQRWDRSKAAKYPVEDGATYCLGWSFSPATSVRQIDTLIPVSYSDGAHMRSSAAGILLSTVSLDSDHHVVPLTYSCLLTNENEHSHTIQLEFSKEMYGEAYDRPERREISDQDKGMEAAWGKAMTNGSKAFNCARHRGDNVSTTVKPGGSEARSLYEQAVKALTLPRLEEIKALYSPQAAAYLGQVPDAAQYIAACGKLHGESVNSTVEAMNAVNDEVRREFSSGVHMTAALLSCVKKSSKRFNENKTKAHAATGQLPKAVLSKMKDVLEKAGTITAGVSFPARNDKKRPYRKNETRGRK